MKGIKAIALVIVAAPSIGYADTEQTKQIRACYFSGTSIEAKYACMGSSVTACSKNNGASIVDCANAETNIWKSLMDEETAYIESILRDERIISGSCLGNDAGCLQGLQNLLSDGASDADFKCVEEAGPKHNAGFPEMAMALCMMRETARNTIRVHSFGAGMGQYSPK